MIRTFLGAAATAAIVFAVAPAQAASVGCSGTDLARTEGAVELMADGPAKFVAAREIAAAQDALLKGSMRGCAVHLGRAARAGTMSQSPSSGYPYSGTMAQAPADTRRRSPAPDWQALTPAL